MKKIWFISQLILVAILITSCRPSADEIYAKRIADSTHVNDTINMPIEKYQKMSNGKIMSQDITFDAKENGLVPDSDKKNMTFDINKI